jgi:pimeloyl-ACP methyl ester carboxylesterase
METPTRREPPSALLIPGMSLNATVFPDLGIPSLAAEFTTLALTADGDLPPGTLHGMTPYRERLDELLGSAPAWRSRRRIVVAHSFGGMLALSWLLAHGMEGPARIDGLVLAATSAGPMYDVVTLRLVKLKSWELRIGLAPWMGVWNRPAVTRAVKRLLTGGSLKPRAVDFGRLRWRGDFALDLAGWRNTDWRAMRSYRLAMRGFDVRGRLAEITVPTVVLHGSEDVLFPPTVGRDLARGLPDAEFRLVRGAGHGLPLTHGEEIVAAVERLLD